MANLVMFTALAILCSSSICLAAQSDTAKTLQSNLSGLPCNETVDRDACLFGGRIYSLLHYTDKQKNLLDDCMTTCNDSFTDKRKCEACQTGCSLGVKGVKLRDDQLENFQSHESNVMRRAQTEQMLSHWMFEMLTGFDVFNDWYDAGHDSSSPEVASYLVIQQSNDQVSIASYRFVVDRVVTSGNAVRQLPSRYDQVPSYNNVYGDSKDEDFEPCLSIPEYSRIVLCLLLMSSGMVLLWLSCTTITTAPKRHAKDKTQKKGKIPLFKFAVEHSLPMVHKKKGLVPDEDDDVKLLDA